MLAQRVITAAVGIPIIAGVILLGGIVYAVVAAAILAIASLEYTAATDPLAGDSAGRTAPGPLTLLHPRVPALLAAAAAALLAIAAREGFDEMTGALALGITLPFFLLILRGDPASGLRDWAWTVPAVAYVGFLGAHLVLLRELDDDGKWVFLAVLGTWATDTFAYFGGRAFGRHHPVPKISPGKTDEGFIIGYAGGFAAIMALDIALDLPLTTAQAAVLAVLFPAAAFVGDLAESLIKRGAQIKDTSELVPGHGGFLDRLDSILFTVPLVYYFVIWVV
ncbi:MAG TPA: phosphatidate cytidylyltransferase [Dehalococcoidia bacterium]|nr:phosphatidate cytidylyltransferase [Dehalococcoidia bacterium]